MKAMRKGALRQLISKSADESSVERRGVRKRGRPIGDRAAKSNRLLAAARAVIARDGYAGASLRKVAQHASCTTGSVTYYFENKEAMVAAVTEALFDEFDEWLGEEATTVNTRAIFEKMILWTMAGKGDAWLVALQLLIGARGNPALADVFQRRYARFRHKLAKLVERGQQQGAVRQDFSADLLADQISAMADGWAMMFPVEPERFSRGRIHELVKMAVAMLSAERA